MLWFALIAVVSCQRRLPIEDTGQTVQCVMGDAPQDAGYTSRTGEPYRVVELHSDTVSPLYAMVSFPEDGRTAWPEGAAVAVTAPPVEMVQTSWEEAPETYLLSPMGIIEVKPIWPGWSVKGHRSGGAPDAGGDASAAALAATIAFAAGATEAVDGRSIEDMVSTPICRSPLPVLAMSSGSIPAIRALDRHAQILEGLVGGAVLYEPPPLPEFVTNSAGVIWMDPDPLADADGDGLPWNDARNHSFDEHSCTRTGCDIALESLAWTQEVALRALWPNAPAGIPAGMLYLDRDANGRLDVSGGTTDLNGYGAIGPDEDAFFRPHTDNYTDPTQLTFYYPPSVTSHAERSVFPAGEWPDVLADSEASTAFWQAHSMAPHLAPAAASHPTLRFSVIYKTVPHGCAATSRPDTRLVYDLLLTAKADVRYNTSVESARCVLSAEEASNYTGGPEPGSILEPDELHAYAFPRDIQAKVVKAIATIDMLNLIGPPIQSCF